MIFPLKGNARVKESVQNFILSGRLPHAIIIEGDAGTGRKTLARFLAKTVVCENEEKPCGNCRGCHLSDIGSHPDIEAIRPAEKKKNIAVDQIRDLRETAYHSPHTADGRVFIIEQAETMNANSQNSLLKVLEEPPGRVVFILITTAAEKLLETVVSRCTVLSLFPPEIDEGVEVLSQIHGANEKDFKEALIKEGGNIGKALEKFEGKLSSKGAAAANEYFETLGDGGLLDALLITASLEKNRPLATEFTAELKEIIVEKLKRSRNLTQTAKELARMYAIVCEYEQLLLTNINLALFFTALTSKLFAVKDE